MLGAQSVPVAISGCFSREKKIYHFQVLKFTKRFFAPKRCSLQPGRIALPANSIIFEMLSLHFFAQNGLIFLVF